MVCAFTLREGRTMSLIDCARTIPLEIFLIVRGFIDSSDLRTHVCFYQCSTQIAALYDTEKDADSFWELACWSCGIGVTGNDARANVCWRDIAIDCIEHDGFCTIPGCGEELLEANRERMTRVMEEVELDPLEVYFDGIPQGVTLLMHPVLERISFKPERNNGATILYDARLRVAGMDIRHEDEDARCTVGVHLREGMEDEEISEEETQAGVNEDDEGPDPTAEEAVNGGTAMDRELAEYEDHNAATASGYYPPFAQHPIAYRSFATSIPVQRLGLLPIGGHLLRRFAIRSDAIITVFDVISAIQYDLDLILDAKESKVYIEEHIYCLRHLTTEKSYERLTHLRGILGQCPITTFTHMRDEPGSGSLFAVQLELLRDPFIVWMEGLQRRLLG
ncbi:hypothetical protein GY45DRAFT_1320615 [Cubamyces sp. BRFM 1775]|nr:hypothetical protein GY45DRAFT_1320615 [Cubamyces sp. BRFM 1775]